MIIVAVYVASAGNGQRWSATVRRTSHRMYYMARHSLSLCCARYRIASYRIASHRIARQPPPSFWRCSTGARRSTNEQNQTPTDPISSLRCDAMRCHRIRLASSCLHTTIQDRFAWRVASVTHLPCPSRSRSRTPLVVLCRHTNIGPSCGRSIHWDRTGRAGQGAVSP